MQNFGLRNGIKLVRNGVKCDVLNNNMPSASGGFAPDPHNHSNHQWKETNEACSKCCALSIIGLCPTPSASGDFVHAPLIPTDLHDLNVSEAAKN